MKEFEFRILEELDENGQPMGSFGIYDTHTHKIVEWTGNLEDALDWVKANGTLACIDK